MYSPVLAAGKTISRAAFPGAEGWGAMTVGGHKGDIYRVTSLDDDGSKQGTLRYAIEQKGKRVIIFDVCGYIELEKNLEIKHSYLTIAGQTAPGQGITLRNFPLIVKKTNDVIIRHLRVRPGAHKSSMDAISIKKCNNVILDHVSATWGNDESVSVTDNSTNITIQWCIIGATQRIMNHSKGSILTSDYSNKNGGISVHHNFYTSCDDRMPKFGTGHNWGKGKTTRVDFINNVVFNWGTKNSGRSGKNQKVQVNYINNWLQPGKDTDKDIRKYAFTKTNDRLQLYIIGNYLLGSLKKNQEDLVRETKNKFVDKEFSKAPIKIVSQPADEAKDDIIRYAGALFSNRDQIDQNLINQLYDKNGGNIPEKIKDKNYIPLICNNYIPPTDTDKDGIPDDWEKKHGSNPDKYDGDKTSSSGYTYLEDYLNSFYKQ